MQICFIKGQLDHGDVHRRVSRWICIRGPCIVEDGHVGKVVKGKISATPGGGESTEPYSR